MATIRAQYMIHGVTRGTMEGQPWARVHVVEKMEKQDNDNAGDRCCDVRGDFDFIEKLRKHNIVLPMLLDCECELTVNKKGASMKIIDFVPPGRPSAGQQQPAKA